MYVSYPCSVHRSALIGDGEKHPNKPQPWVGSFQAPVTLHSEMTLITAFVWDCHVDVNGRLEVNSVQEMSALEELGNLNNSNALCQ
jgi:hypothetical protein